MISVPLNILRAVKVCAARNDIRHYLNGVLVTNIKGALALVATDGHRLTVFCDKDIPYDGEDFIMPVDLIDAAPKPPKIFKRGSTAKVGCVEIGIEGNVITIRALKRSVSDEKIDGKFPVWQKIIPKPLKDSVARGYVGLNPIYLGGYAQMQKLLNRQRYSGINIAANGDEPCLVDIGDERFLCVVMPMRVSPVVVPSWFTYPKVDTPNAEPLVADAA